MTNGDFPAFIADGGYRRPELWLSLGWDWVRAGARRAPLYWQRSDGRWRCSRCTAACRVDAARAAWRT